MPLRDNTPINTIWKSAAMDTRLPITPHLSIPLTEIELHQIRAQGAGGQNVNKVSSSVHLRYPFLTSSLPESYKERLLNLQDQRITKEGVIVIKAQRHRSYEKNREDALLRLQALIRAAGVERKRRKPTRPSRSAQTRRLDKKSQRGKTKTLRKKIRQ